MENPSESMEKRYTWSKLRQVFSDEVKRYKNVITTLLCVISDNLVKHCLVGKVHFELNPKNYSQKQMKYIQEKKNSLKKGLLNIKTLLKC